MTSRRSSRPSRTAAAASPTREHDLFEVSEESGSSFSSSPGASSGLMSVMRRSRIGSLGVTVVFLSASRALVSRPARLFGAKRKGKGETPLP